MVCSELLAFTRLLRGAAREVLYGYEQVKVSQGVVAISLWTCVTLVTGHSEPKVKR